MSISCIRYQPRTGDSLRGVADLEFNIPDVGAMEIKDFTVYEQGGAPYDGLRGLPGCVGRCERH
jgi:hypothetical protein